MRKIVWLGAIAILIGYALYFHFAKEHMFRSLLREKVVSIANDVNYVSAMVDYLVEQDGGWDDEKYRDALVFLTERIDATPNVYAELLDSHFKTLSDRIVPESDSWFFEPREFPDLMGLLLTENMGYFQVICPERMCPNTHKPLEVHLHWQWIPTSGQYENRVLLVVGVTQHSVNAALESWLIYGIVALLFTSAVFIVGSIILATAKRRKRSV